MVNHPNLPVRRLYEVVQSCDQARKIFHANHVEKDKLDYMFKLVRSEMYMNE
jgi:hypothetical protein